MSYAVQPLKGVEQNRLYEDDRPVHEWYRFVLSYPPHLVRDYLERFQIGEGQCVLDPFCGTGTTLVECKKNGISSVGLEANPVVHFAAQTKCDWSPDPEDLLNHAERIAEQVRSKLMDQGISDVPFFSVPHRSDLPLKDLDPERKRLLIAHSISPLPLHKVLVLLNEIEASKEEALYAHERLALAKHLVYSISNLRFGPEVGVGKKKRDAPVVEPWLSGVRDMADDLAGFRSSSHITSNVYLADARAGTQHLELQSIDAVITSPPYPNEKDYTRTTRLESVLLGFLNSREELRAYKKKLIRSNTRNIYKDDRDDHHITGIKQIYKLVETIENRRLELGKTSGFEKMYHRVVIQYFGGMARHLAELRPFLRPGARLAYVVGDQASYFRIPIRTGQILAEVAESLGYLVEDIDLFRTRFATAPGEQLREEVLVLRWK